MPFQPPFGPVVGLLLLFVGCRVPAPTPEHAASISATGLPVTAQEAYKKAFIQGARMPEAAVKVALRPVEPRTSISLDELDPDTGLVRWDLSTSKDSPSTKGLVDGFAWGLERTPSLKKSNLIPGLPAMNEFTVWSAGPNLLQSEGWSMVLNSQGGVLVWAARYQGFQAVRGWRDVTDLGDLKATALTGSSLWVVGSKATWLLDVSTSALRKIGPTIEVVIPSTNTSREDDGALDFKVLAEKGDSKAMVVLGSVAEQEGKYDDALMWYHRAVDGGDTSAMEHLAMMAVLGRGGPVDRAAAKRWLVLAQAKGDPEAPGLILALEHPENLVDH